MNKLLKFLLLAAFINALSWIIIIPLWQYPDEQAHFAQVQDLAELGYVPTDSNDTSYEIALSEKILGTEKDWQGNNKFTYHPEFRIEYSDTQWGKQESAIVDLPKEARVRFVKDEATLNPPLYYKSAAAFYNIFLDSSLFGRIFAVRIFSSLIFLILIIVAFKIGQLIFEKNKSLPLILASLVAFKPMLVFTSTGVLPDSLTNLLFAVVLFTSLKIIETGISLGKIVLMVSAVFLLFYTRQQAFIAIPIAFVPIIYQFFVSRKHLFGFAKPTFLFLVLILPLIAYLFTFEVIKNLSGPEIGNIELSLLLSQSFLDHSIWTLKHTFYEVLPWYWGVYRWLSLTLPPLNYQIVNRFIFLALLGILVRAYQVLKKNSAEVTDKYILFLGFVSLIYFLVFLVWDFYFRLNRGFSFGIQGRYFFPMVVAHLAVLLYGFSKLIEIFLKKYSQIFPIFIVFLMIVLNAISLFHVASSYYDTNNLTFFINQASQYKPSILKGSIIPIILTSSFLTQLIYLTVLIRYGKNQH